MVLGKNLLNIAMLLDEATLATDRQQIGRRKTNPNLFLAIWTKRESESAIRRRQARSR